jgi:hypothetical protein
MKTVTRKQLTRMGASKYQAESVTKTLKPICKQGQKNVYDLFAVSDRTLELMKNKRLWSSTRNALQSLRWEILTFAETIQDAPFGMKVTEQIEQAEQLSRRAEALFVEAQAQENQIRRNRKVVPLENRKNVCNFS